MHFRKPGLEEARWAEGTLGKAIAMVDQRDDEGLNQGNGWEKCGKYLGGKIVGPGSSP